MTGNSRGGLLEEIMFKSINGTVMLQKWIKTDTQTDTNALSQKASNLQSIATTGGGGRI